MEFNIKPIVNNSEDFIKENNIELKIKGEDSMCNNKIKYVEDNGYIIENEKDNNDLNEMGLIADKLKQAGTTVGEAFTTIAEAWNSDLLNINKIEEAKNGIKGMQENTVKFAKVRPTAKIPSKNVEDGGYDVYADFEDDYIIIHPHQTKMIPTGIASAFSDDYVFVGRERGSTGSKGMAIRSSVIDSGYRGEWFVPITNTNNYPIIICKTHHFDDMPNVDLDKTLHAMLELDALKNDIDVNYVSKIPTNKIIMYPYEKAICQVLLVPVPKVEVQELDLKSLQSIPSKRGMGALGSSGK